MNKKIKISDTLFLQPYDYLRKESLVWYSDLEIQWLVNGTSIPFNYSDIERMYEWQNEHGELFYIEYLEKNIFQTIGDVCFSDKDFAIVIDKRFQGRGVGKKVVKYFENKLNKNKSFRVKSVYKYNKGSQRLFESLGFEKIDNGDYYSYRK